MNRASMLLLFNPRAGQGVFVRNLYEVLDKFTKHGFLVTAYPTQGTRDAYRMALEHGAEYDYLVCSGGDGTFSEVADAIMQLPVEKSGELLGLGLEAIDPGEDFAVIAREKTGGRPVFGYIPSGTSNDFAVSLGLPVDVLLAAEAICTGAPKTIDMGCFQGEHFSYVAAFGLFADVSYGTPQNMKNVLGHAAYMLEGVKRLAGIKSWHCTVDCDGEIIAGNFVFGMVANSTTIGGFKLPVDYGSVQGDGLFELVLIKEVRHFAELQEVMAVLSGAAKLSEFFIVRSARSITVTCESGEEIEWTLDGEYGGKFRQAAIEIIPRALQLMTPEVTHEP